MRKYGKILLSIVGITVVLNLFAFCTDFCNFYTDYIYVYIANGYGWLMDWIPFAMGEIFMYLGMIFILLLPITGIVYFFVHKKPAIRLWLRRYLKGVLALAVVILFVYTTLWFIPFRADSLDVKPDIDRTYSLNELELARAYVVNQMNDIAKKIQRDQEGHILYCEDMAGETKEAFAIISKEYPRLKGHYPEMKEAFCSDFLEWMGIGGYTYPYTMEITCNRYTARMDYPTLYAHEMAHHKGYYKENEANFISFRVCSSSDELCLQYSAYREIFYYLDNDYYENIVADDSEAAWEQWEKQPQPSEQVMWDEEDIANERAEMYEEGVNTVLEESVSGYAEEASEVGWDTQADILNEANYDGVVAYVLEYYDGVLY